MTELEKFVATIDDINTGNPVRQAFLRMMVWLSLSRNRELWPGGPTGETYAQGFIRKPSNGSFVKKMVCTSDRAIVVTEMTTFDDVQQFLESLDWDDVTSTLPKTVVRDSHQYYQAKITPFHDYRAFTNVRSLASMVTDPAIPIGEQPELALYVVNGPHGYELRTLQSARDVIATDVITAITGGDGLVTWHPGNPASPIDFENSVVKFSHF